MELQNIQQGTTGHRTSTQGLETLSHWQSTPSLHQIRPQELDIFQDSKETQQETGQVEPIFVEIQYQVRTCTRNQDGYIRHPLTKVRLVPRRK